MHFSDEFHEFRSLEGRFFCVRNRIVLCIAVVCNQAGNLIFCHSLNLDGHALQETMRT